MRKEIAELIQQKLDNVYANHAFACREVEDAENVLEQKNRLLKRTTEHMMDIEELDCFLKKLG